MGSGGGRLLGGWLGKGTGMEAECKLKVMEWSMILNHIDIVLSITIKTLRGDEEEEGGCVNAI